MSATVTATRLVRVAPGLVWALWLQVPEWPRWQPETVSVRWLSGKPWDEESRFLLRRASPYRLLGKLPGLGARRYEGVVRSVTPERLLVWELQPTRGGWFGPTIVQSVRLEPAPSGCQVHLSLSAHGVGPTLLAPLIPQALYSQAEAALTALAAELRPPRS